MFLGFFFTKTGPQIRNQKNKAEVNFIWKIQNCINVCYIGSRYRWHLELPMWVVSVLVLLLLLSSYMIFLFPGSDFPSMKQRFLQTTLRLFGENLIIIKNHIWLKKRKEMHNQCDCQRAEFWRDSDSSMLPWEILASWGSIVSKSYLCEYKCEHRSLQSSVGGVSDPRSVCWSPLPGTYKQSKQLYMWTGC